MIAWVVKEPLVTGPLNGSAPNPVRNSEFTRQLAKRLKRPAILPAPKFGLRIALGEFADSLLASQRVMPAAALEAGFQFKHASLEHALADIISE